MHSEEQQYPNDLDRRLWSAADRLRGNALIDVGTTLAVRNGKTTGYEFRGIGRLLDDTLGAAGP